MENVRYTATVYKDIEDLIPTFLSNRRIEVDALLAAFKCRNFEELIYLGDRMRGCGIPYGFDNVSILGQYISEAAQNKNLRLLGDRIAEYANYLSCVQICFIDAP